MPGMPIGEPGTLDCANCPNQLPSAIEAIMFGQYIELSLIHI